MPTANHRLRRARQSRPSPHGTDWTMTRPEVAAAVNAHLETQTDPPCPVNAYYIARLEAGEDRWPHEPYRAALRSVLGVALDADLGFHPPTGPAGLDGRTPVRLSIRPGQSVLVTCGRSEQPPADFPSHVRVEPGIAVVIDTAEAAPPPGAEPTTGTPPHTGG